MLFGAMILILTFVFGFSIFKFVGKVGFSIGKLLLFLILLPVVLLVGTIIFGFAAIPFGLILGIGGLIIGLIWGLIKLAFGLIPILLVGGGIYFLVKHFKSDYEIW